MMMHPTLSPPVSPHMLHHPHPHSHAHGTSDMDFFLEALAAVEPAKPRTGRDAALDSILFAAAAATGPHMTRHHHSHMWSPVVDGETRIKEGEKDGVPRYKSLQMPRSERLKVLGATVEEGRAIAPPSEDAAPAVVPLKEDKQAQEKMGDAASRPLSARPRTPPTPPLQPSAKRARLASPPHLSLSLPETVPSLPAAEPELEVKCMARTRIPTNYGPVFLHVYHNNRDGKEHLAIVSDPAQLSASAEQSADAPVPIRSRTLDAKWHENETDEERIIRGAYVSRLTPTSSSASASSPTPQPALTDAPLIRIHSECFTGETLGSLRCDCGEQLDASLRLIASTPSARGIVLYLRQEGRGIGLLEKVRAYNLQDLGLDTVQANLALGRGADERAYGVAGAMLRDLGVADAGVRLMTNNPAKVGAMRAEGVRVVQRVALVPRDWQDADADTTAPQSPLATPELVPSGAGAAESRPVRGGVVRSEELERYLRTKVERMGHLLELPGGLAGL